MTAVTFRDMHNGQCCTQACSCSGCSFPQSSSLSVEKLGLLADAFVPGLICILLLLQVLRFWEALWSNPHHEHFHLFVCVAVLEHHRRAIMNTCQDFDSLLKFCVDLSGRIPMASVLQDADALCRWAGDAGLDCVAELGPGPS